MKRLHLIIVILVILVGCEINPDFTTEDYTAYFSDENISTQIEFYPVELYENYNEQGRPILKIKFSTSEIYPCSNYQVAYSQFVNGNELIVRFDKIHKPEICLTALGPATAYIDLPENTKTLILINGNTIDRYSMEITKKKISVSVLVNNFTSILHKSTFRYPENTFAFVCGTNLDNTHLYNDFITLLVEGTSVTEYIFEGDGRIPYPESSSGHWSDNPSRFFRYENEADFDKAGELLKSFTLENITPNDGVGMYLTSWDNRKFMSWMFNR